MLNLSIALTLKVLQDDMASDSSVLKDRLERMDPAQCLQETGQEAFRVLKVR